MTSALIRVYPWLKSLSRHPSRSAPRGPSMVVRSWEHRINARASTGPQPGRQDAGVLSYETNPIPGRPVISVFICVYLWLSSFFGILANQGPGLPTIPHYQTNPISGRPGVPPRHGST
jgi:hypothetical protein